MSDFDKYTNINDLTSEQMATIRTGEVGSLMRGEDCEEVVDTLVKARKALNEARKAEAEAHRTLRLRFLPQWAEESEEAEARAVSLISDKGVAHERIKRVQDELETIDLKGYSPAYEKRKKREITAQLAKLNENLEALKARWAEAEVTDWAGREAEREAEREKEREAERVRLKARLKALEV